MAAAGAGVEFMATAMQRLAALEARVGTVAALEARVAASEAALAAYKAAMPQPQAYYVLLEVPPWTADSRAARLLEVRRRVLTAVASVTDPGMRSEMFVRCFLGRTHGWYIAVVFITCGSCGPTHDPGALRSALSACGTRVVQWEPVMSHIEQLWFQHRVAEPVVHLPIRVGGEGVDVHTTQIAVADAELGFYRLADYYAGHLLDEEAVQRAEAWAEAACCELFVHSAERGDFDATGAYDSDDGA